MSNIDNLLLENEALKTEILLLQELIEKMDTENRKSWCTISYAKV